MRAPTIEQDVAAYIAGDEQAGGRLCRSLEPVVRAEVRRFLSVSDADHDDVVQETLLGLLTYLRRAGRGPDRPEAFVVTMAGNRCRNLYRWRKRRPVVDLETASERLHRDGDDPLAQLEADEFDAALRDAFARLDPPCRRLLEEIYAARRPVEDLRQEAGLGTVQGLYYRKYACLRKLARLLNLDGVGGRRSGPEGPASGT